MPHKRNPVLSENLTGLARIIRSMALPAMENITLWHERDISHSAVERIIGPDATIALDFALARLTAIIDKLTVYPNRMRQNLNSLGGIIHSQRVLLALTHAGIPREDAYRLVQRNAHSAWRAVHNQNAKKSENNQNQFLDLLKADKDIILDDIELEALFDLDYHFKHVDTIFARVFG